MSDLKLTLDQPRAAFAPGDRISGEVQLDTAERPEKLGVQLAWRTEGKGDSDHGVGAREVFDTPSPGQGQRFALTVPDGPMSYDGRLLAIVWQLEAWSEAPDHLETRPIVVSPMGVPLGFAESEET